MEEPYQLQSKIKAKDLPGAIKVMPLGLDAAIKKRVSGEFKSERSSSGVSFSQTSNNNTLQTQPIDSADFSSPMVNFKEMDQVTRKKTDIMSEFQWGNSIPEHSITSQNVISNKSTKSEFSSSFKSQQNIQQSYEAGTSLLTNNQQQMMNVNRNQIMDNNQHQMISNQEALHGEEIKQHNLKSQIRSAIYDLENEIGPDFENQIKSPTPAKTGLFSPPPLERISEPPEFTVPKAENSIYPSFENPIPNGHASFNTMESNAVNIDIQRVQEESSSIQINGNYEESSNCIQESGSSASLYDKIMTPASQEFDSGSIKRRDPRKMFTDSSFYSAAHHPTVADQVEMAHRLSCALFNDENFSLNRAKRSGETIDDEESPPRHDKVPNLKLVMNPKGKVQDWSDVAPEDMVNETAVAAVPSPLIDGDNGKGGELFAKRRKKAENWVVDENTTGQEKPSNFADKVMQRKMFDQQKLEQAQQAEKKQNQLIDQQQQKSATHSQLESQQQFQMQSSSKQAQSLEIRRHKELQQSILNQPQIDLPEDFQHCTLINQSNGPSFDKSCHNVQGINVWSNTAPRGWASSHITHRTVGQKTTNLNNSEDLLVAAKMTQKEKQMMQQQEELRFEQRMLEEQQMIEQQRMDQYQMEQHRIEGERLKQQKIEEQRMEEHRIEQQRIEQEIMEQQQMERRIIEEQRLEHQRMEQQRVEEQRLEQQRIEQQRTEQQQMEQRRIEQQRLEHQRMEQQRVEEQRLEQQKIEQQQMEQRRIEEQRLEQQRLEQQRIEEERMEQQSIERHRIEQQRVEEQILEQQKIKQQRMEQQRVEQQKLEQQRMEQKRMENQRREQQQMEHQIMEQQRTEQERMEEQSMEEPFQLQSKIRAKDLPGAIKVMPNGLDAAIKKRVSGEFKSERTSNGMSFSQTSNNQAITKQQIAVQQQQQTSMQQWSSTEKRSQASSVSSSKTTMRAGQGDLEPEKRNEYEAWFKNQEKEAMEYSASIKYQERGSETKETNTTVKSTDQKSNQMKGDFQSMSIGMTKTPSFQSHELPQVKPSLLFTESEQNVRSKSEGILHQSSLSGSRSKLMNTWDNHNTIARGWGCMKENYHPVTFRDIYNVESQTPLTSQNL